MYQGMPGSKLSRLLGWLKKGQEKESRESMANQDRLTDRDRVAETQGPGQKRIMVRLFKWRF